MKFIKVSNGIHMCFLAGEYTIRTKHKLLAKTTTLQIANAVWRTATDKVARERKVTC